MGTRHLIAVVLGGTHRVAQYGQWDGYPEGQGVVAADFARSLADPDTLSKFKASVERCRFASEKEIEAIYDSYSTNGLMTMEQSEAFNKSKYGYFSRDTGAKILEAVAKWDGSEEMLLSDQYEFAADGLFCEWAYVIDLDNEKLEVYSGFNKVPAPEGQRFAALNEKADKEYGPVHLLTEFTFKELALMTDDEFVKSVIAKDKELKPDHYEEDEETEEA